MYNKLTLTACARLFIFEQSHPNIGFFYFSRKCHCTFVHICKYVWFASAAARRAVTVVHLRVGFFSFVPYTPSPEFGFILATKSMRRSLKGNTHTHISSLFSFIFLFFERAFSHVLFRIIICASAMTKENSFECNRACARIFVFIVQNLLCSARVCGCILLRCRPFTSVHCAHAHQVKKIKHVHAN